MSTERAKLPAPPAEVKRNASRDGLAPKFVAALDGLLAELAALGTPGLLFETLRTDHRQLFLFGFGREYDDGRGIVTYSETADDTWHGYGMAADIVSKRAKNPWDDPEFYENVMRLAPKYGLLSGADWNRNGTSADERFVDGPHVQWGRLRRSPSPNAARIVDQRGLQGLWEYVGAA